MALSFDPTYYLSTRPDVFNYYLSIGAEPATGMDWAAFAENHYNTFGWKEGANPNAIFDTTDYLAANLDVAEAGVNPFTHYLQFGANEGREPSASFIQLEDFDWETYLDENPDLGEAGIDTAEAAYGHFVVFGQFEDRPGMPEVIPGIPGETFALTENPDLGAAFTGGAANDTFIAADKTIGGTGVVPTWTAADAIDGGGGYNTFQIISEFTVENPAGSSVKNIQEVKVVAAGGGVDLDTTEFSGLEKLNINASGSAGDVVAAETTDVIFNIVEADGWDASVEGGNNVIVTATKADGDEITVTGAAGDVVVSSTGDVYSGSGNVTLGKITVEDGATISVTQQATSNGSKAAKSTANGTITQGVVDITAGDETTTVTVNQDAAVTAGQYAAAVAGKVEVVRVDFVDVTAGTTVEVNGLEFTATKDLTGAEVAQAFANLLANAALPKDATPTLADGDTQGSGKFENGFFTGSLAPDLTTGAWSSSAANSNSVTFTASRAGDAADLTVSADATATVTTAGVTEVPGKAGVVGVAAGKVTITGAAALETVTVDGYGTSSGIAGTTNDALASVTLSNGAGFTIASAAETLDLEATLNAAGTINVTAGTTTLNATINGSKATTLTSASVTALNVAGSGVVAGNNSDLSVVESIDASEFTGEANFTIDATRTTYEGGEGEDNLILASVVDATKITESIDLGAGDDTLDLSNLDGGDVLQLQDGVVFEGGEGNDTVILSDIAVETVASNSFDANNFLSHISGFEEVKIGKLDADRNIKLGNLGYESVALVDLNGQNLTLADTVSGVTVAVEGNSGGGGSLELKFKGMTGTKTAAEANLVIGVEGSSAADIDAGTFRASNLDTLNITANANSNTVTPVSSDHTVTVDGKYISTINVDGAAETLTLNFDTGGNQESLSSIDASEMLGGLIVDLGNVQRAATPGDELAISVYGGQGADLLVAGAGFEDELYGGAGNDVLIAGNKSSVLTGGAGNDVFVINTAGNATVADHSIITDFKNGSDLLQLFDDGGNVVSDFIQATGIVQASDLETNVNHALSQTTADGEAVWFSWQGSTYVVVDNDSADNVFTTGVDAIVRLTGVNLNDGFSFNTEYGTLALV